MTRKPFIPRALLVVLGVAGSIGGAGAVVGATAPVATVQSDSGLVRWIPAVDSAGSTLVLADPTGAVRSFRFQPGETPAVSLFDAQGASLSDGTYTWELRLTPPGVDPREPGRQAQAVASRVTSGYFTLAGGALLDPDLAEAPETRLRRAAAPGLAVAPDQMVPDDLIVDGKGCIGLGCTNNELFSNEALRLKQSVVWLRFEDTSSQAGFATRDWQLRINDPASGGANRFSIEDLDPAGAKVPFTIEAGAPTDSIHVTNVGRLGLRTAVPALDLHIASSGTPGIRLDKTGTGAQGWDILGDNTGFSIKDSTSNKSPLKIAVSAPTGSFSIAPNGFVGLGTSAPTAYLDVQTNFFGSEVARFRNANPAGFTGFEFLDENNAVCLFVGLDNSGNHTRFNSINNHPLLFMTNFGERIRIASTGNIGLGGVSNPTHPLQHANGGYLRSDGFWIDASSRRYKRDIVDLEIDEARMVAMSLRPVKFEHVSAPDRVAVGFIAEDVPELVASPGRAGLSPMEIVSVLTRVVQDQQVQIDSLRAEIQQLKPDFAVPVSQDP